MLRALESRDLHIGSSDSRIGFETQGGGAWPVWDRFLTVDGKRAYHIGNICQTCNFFFERLSGANTSINIDEAVDALRAGLGGIADPTVETLGNGLSEDDYIAVLTESLIELARPGSETDYFAKEGPALFGPDTFYDLPHDPRISYYRAGQRRLLGGAQLFHFVVPMFPENWLGTNVVDEYSALLGDGAKSTAVAISVLDVKAPATFSGDPEPDVTEHWCYTHYVIDGHHKIAAARRTSTPIRLLTFTSTTKGTCSREQLKTAIQASS